MAPISARDEFVRRLATEALASISADDWAHATGRGLAGKAARYVAECWYNHEQNGNKSANDAIKLASKRRK